VRRDKKSNLADCSLKDPAKSEFDDIHPARGVFRLAYLNAGGGYFEQFFVRDSTASSIKI